MSKDKLRYILDEILSLLTNRQFILNIFGIILFLTLIMFGVFSWLRSYTHHGQKKELPDYVNQDLRSSQADAESRSFKIIVNDSVHIVGKPGGMIQNQNPPGGSLVKENRKIYVTTTKFRADQVDLSDMRFFGEEYTQVEAALKTKNVYSKIKEYQFDPLTQNSVLEVWHNGRMIISRQKPPEKFVVDKGDTLEFVVSSSQGGSSEVPDLIGETIGVARFILEPTGLNLSISNAASIDAGQEAQAIITSQDPPESTTLPRGSTISVRVSIN